MLSDSRQRASQMADRASPRSWLGLKEAHRRSTFRAVGSHWSATRAVVCVCVVFLLGFELAQPLPAQPWWSLCRARCRVDTRTEERAGSQPHWEPHRIRCAAAGGSCVLLRGSQRSCLKHCRQLSSPCSPPSDDASPSDLDAATRSLPARPRSLSACLRPYGQPGASADFSVERAAMLP